jgi:hypothetical protein
VVDANERESDMTDSAYYSLVIDRPAADVWDVVRDFFTYESCEPLEIDVAGAVRTIPHYQGTRRLWPIIEGDRCFALWSAEYDCPHRDAEYWAAWWAAMVPTWLGSLRDHVHNQGKAGDPPRNPFGVPDVPDPDGDDITAFASSSA